MSIISNDFGAALGQLRNAVSQLTSTVTMLQAEIDALKKELKSKEDTFTDVNGAILRAAASGNQEQLLALNNQPLTSKQAEIIRLALQDEIIPQEFDLNSALIENMRAAAPQAKRQYEPAPVEDMPSRMQQAANHLSQQAQTFSNSRQMQADATRRFQQIQQNKQRYANNAIGSLIRRNDSLDDY